MWWSVFFVFLGFAFIGGLGFALACLIPGIQDRRTRKSQFFGGITEKEHPIRYRIGTAAWFTLALLFLVGTILGWLAFLGVW